MQNDLKLNHEAALLTDVFGIDSPPSITEKLTPGVESKISELVELIVNDSKTFNEMCFLLICVGGFMEQEKRNSFGLLDIINAIR